MTTATAPLIAAEGEILATAANRGWTAKPIGTIGHDFTRGVFRLRVLFTTNNAARRTVREVEWTQSLDGNYGETLGYWNAGTPHKRGQVLDILDTNDPTCGQCGSPESNVRHHVRDGHDWAAPARAFTPGEIAIAEAAIRAHAAKVRQIAADTAWELGQDLGLTNAQVAELIAQVTAK